MKTVTLLLAIAAAVVHAQPDASVCDSRYDCEVSWLTHFTSPKEHFALWCTAADNNALPPYPQYAFRGNDGKNYVYDLAPLCREGGYIAKSAAGSQYMFNSTCAEFLHLADASKTCHL